MMSSKVFFICLVFLAGALVEAGQSDSEQQAGKEQSVVVVEAHNMVIRAPYFNASAEPLPDEVRQYHGKLVRDVMGPMKSIIKGAFVKGQKYLLMPTVTKVAVQFLWMAVGFFSNAIKLQKKYNLPSDKEFQRSSVQVFPELIKRSKADLKEATPEEIKRYKSSEARKQFGENLMKIIDGVQMLVVTSPVGMYLDFKAITIDGTLLTEHGLEALKFLHKNGFGWMINKLDWLSGMIVQEQAEISVNGKPGNLEEELMCLKDDSKCAN